MFLRDSDTPEAAAFLKKDRQANGYVMGLERAWAWRPEIAEAFVALRKQLLDGSTLTPREVALVVCATAQARGDSYCALAWGSRLAKLAGARVAAEVLSGQEPAALTAREEALRRWTGQVVTAPSLATPAQVEALRAAGFSEREIFEATALVAFRLAFATVNDALGAPPDAQLSAEAPAEVRAAVTYGRPAAT
jgi:uncharacterized peroxidase-related enzyme